MVESSCFHLENLFRKSYFNLYSFRDKNVVIPLKMYYLHQTLYIPLTFCLAYLPNMSISDLALLAYPFNANFHGI